MMEEYRAYWYGGKQEVLLKLLFGVVTRIVEYRPEELIAYALTPEGEEFRFRVSKRSQPFGARCQVHPKGGSQYPSISTSKAQFEVKVNTVVLFPRPLQSGASAYPVISWEDYQMAVREPESRVIPAEDVPHRKGEHRWVEAPPYHPHHNAAS